MYKFFIEDNQLENMKAKIIGEDVNHIKNVLRLKEGENVLVCNKRNAETFYCKIEEVNSQEITCSVVEKVIDSTEPKTYIHIFQGLPKAEKLEWIIEKCTELGVKEITPVEMQRSIAKVNEKDKRKKEARWQRIAEIAAKQSKRDCILQVNPITNFKNIFSNLLEYDIVLVAYEKEMNMSLKKAVKNFQKKNKSIRIAVMIGPEGGITEEELDKCKENGVLPITLGKRILRTETAPIVVASNLLYALEEE